MLKSQLKYRYPKHHYYSIEIQLTQMGGLTALHIACGLKSKKSVNLVKLLLDYGADPNIRALDDHVTYSVGKYQKVGLLAWVVGA